MEDKIKKSNLFLQRLFKFRWLPLVIFIILILLTLFLTSLVRSEIESDIKITFDEEINLVEQSILTRADIYINALRSGIALFEASEAVSREEWRIFSESIDLQKNFPGIQGFGYSQLVPAEEKQSFINSVRSNGFPEFDIRPAGIRSEYTAIIYLEPFDLRNRQAFGYDMFSEAVRHEAMASARDSGLPWLSGRVTLVQEIDEDVQAGFLIYLPLYKKSVSLESIEDRQQSLIGYVYSPFRANDFFNGLFGNRELLVDFAVVDGGVDEISQKNLIYSSLGKNQLFNEEFYDQGEFSAKRVLEVDNHKWTIFFTLKPEAINNFSGTRSPNLLLWLGLIISLLIGLIIYAFVSYRNQAIKLADKITEDLKGKTKEIESSKKKLENVNKDLKDKTKTLSVKLKELAKLNKYMIDREESMINLKKQLAEAKKNKNSFKR